METKQKNNRYKILVQSFSGKVLGYHVNSYKIDDNSAMISFTDNYTGEIKSYPLVRCEIVERPRNEIGDNDVESRSV